MSDRVGRFEATDPTIESEEPMSTTAMAFPRELLTPPCRHERVEFPARPLPDAWYVCPDCGERVGLRGGRVLTLRESNAIAAAVTTELKPGRSYVVRLTEHVSPEAMEVLSERLKLTAPNSGFLIVDASVISVEDDAERKNWPELYGGALKALERAEERLRAVDRGAGLTLDWLERAVQSAEGYERGAPGYGPLRSSALKLVAGDLRAVLAGRPRGRADEPPKPCGRG